MSAASENDFGFSQILAPSLRYTSSWFDGVFGLKFIPRKIHGLEVSLIYATLPILWRWNLCTAHVILESFEMASKSQFTSPYMHHCSRDRPLDEEQGTRIIDTVSKASYHEFAEMLKSIHHLGRASNPR